MTCDRVRPLFERYLAGELAPGRERAVRDHLTECETCRQELEVREPMALFSRLETRETEAHRDDAEAREFLLAVRRGIEIRSAERATRRGPRRRWLMAAAAAFVVVAAGASLLLAPSPAPPTLQAKVPVPAAGNPVVPVISPPRPAIEELDLASARVYEFEPLSADDAQVVWIVDEALDL